LAEHYPATEAKSIGFNQACPIAGQQARQHLGLGFADSAQQTQVIQVKLNNLGC
jgi:hypothetical protein